MANKKISELPSATEPLNDADLVEVVQGGINKKAPKSAFGGGAVDSVNGQTGVVVVDAGDIAFTPAGNLSATDVQAALEELDSETVMGRAMVAATGAVISFAIKQYYGSAAAITGNITFSTTGALLGMEQVMRHNDSVEPSFPSEFKRMEGSRAYVTSVDNFIYLKYLSATKIQYTINQEQ